MTRRRWKLIFPLISLLMLAPILRQAPRSAVKLPRIPRVPAAGHVKSDRLALTVAAPDRIPGSETEGEVDSCFTRIDREREARCGKRCAMERLFLSGSWAGTWLSEGWNDDSESAPTPHQTTWVGKLDYALAEAGLLEAPRSDRLPTRDDEDAFNRLDEVRRHDPENSVPYLFMAVIRERQGRQDEASALIRDAHRYSRRYDSYFLSLAREVLRGSLQDPLEALEAVGVNAALPIPSLSSLRAMLERIDPDRAKFGLQMMEPMLAADGKYGEIRWAPVEYSIGRALFASAGNDAKGFPTLKQIWDRERENQQTDYIFRLTDDFMGDMEVNGCDPEVLRPWLRELSDALAGSG